MPVPYAVFHSNRLFFAVDRSFVGLCPTGSCLGRRSTGRLLLNKQARAVVSNSCGGELLIRAAWTLRVRGYTEPEYDTCNKLTHQTQ